MDVRVIAATNKNLEEMIEQGTFRSDLYYRLNVVPLNIPPLRERKDDVILLSRSLLERLNKNSEEKVSLSSDVIKVLQKYNWPGNIRELQNVLEHANIIRTGNQVEVKDLPKYIVPKEYKLDVKHLETFNLKSNIKGGRGHSPKRTGKRCLPVLFVSGRPDAVITNNWSLRRRLF